MKPALLLVVAVVLIALGACRSSKHEDAVSSQAQAEQCSEQANRWAKEADAANGDVELTLVSAGYSASQQSCVIYYKTEIPPVATYAVENLVTHAPYASQDCSTAQKNCDAAQAKSKAVFDALTKTTVSAKK